MGCSLHHARGPRSPHAAQPPPTMTLSLRVMFLGGIFEGGGVRHGIGGSMSFEGATLGLDEDYEVG